jgi:shikimate dehydrogenase
MFEKAFGHHDLDWRYLTFEVPPESLEDAVRGLRALGFCGGHCGDPHRQAVASWLDRTTETAALVGNVNLIFREQGALIGDNTEGKAVVQTIRSAIDPAGKNVVLLGAGRVARATTAELAAAGAQGITVVGRTESRVAELISVVAGKFDLPVAAVAWHDDYSVPPEVDILVFAASHDPAGGKDRLPLVLDTLRPGLVVADVTIDSTPTWLLTEAARHGCTTVDGLSMCIEQAASGFRLWTGVDADRQVLREAVEEFLGL